MLRNAYLVYFLNLAVRVKLHLDAPRAEGTDRQSLLEYYDMFPRLPKYAAIKPRDFHKRPLRMVAGRKRNSNGAEQVEEYGHVKGMEEDIDEDASTDGADNES